MQQGAKYASPIIVLLGVLFFRGNLSQFVLPLLLEVLSISSFFLLCKPLREKPGAFGLLMFWLAPLALLWLLSERKEGRGSEPISITVELILAGIGTAILLSGNRFEKGDMRLIGAILLTWAVAFFSGGSGGADHMTSLFGFLHLTQDQLDILIKIIRKGIHLSFYGTLTYFVASYLFPQIPSRKTVYGFAVALPLLVAISDEYRQSMMANRQGSLMDVFLDMSATFVVLIVFLLLARKKNGALAPIGQKH